MANNEVLIVDVGTSSLEQIVFADHAGDFGPATANDLREDASNDVEVGLATAALAADAAVNSDKVDLGARRARAYSVDACFEFAATPTAGAVVEFWWSPSPASAAGTGNPGLPDGVDGAYTGDGSGTIAESVRQMQFIGSFICTDRAQASGVQIANVSEEFRPAHRYGQLVLFARTGADLYDTDDEENHVVFTPIVDEIE